MHPLYAFIPLRAANELVFDRRLRLQIWSTGCLSRLILHPAIFGQRSWNLFQSQLKIRSQLRIIPEKLNFTEVKLLWKMQRFRYVIRRKTWSDKTLSDIFFISCWNFAFFFFLEWRDKTFKMLHFEALCYFVFNIFFKIFNTPGERYQLVIH